MNKALKSCWINHHQIKFQESRVSPIGGPEGTVVIYTMGNPVHEDGSPMKIGDHHPFMGYNLSFELAIIPNEIDMSKKNKVHLIFFSGEEFEGFIDHIAHGTSTVRNDSTLYENVSFVVSTPEGNKQTA